MPLVNMKDMLEHAHRHGYAVGAFDLVSLDFLQGIMDAAERCKAPVILSLAESHFQYFNFELLMPAADTPACSRERPGPSPARWNAACACGAAPAGPPSCWPIASPSCR